MTEESGKTVAYAVRQWTVPDQWCPGLAVFNGDGARGPSTIKWRGGSR